MICPRQVNINESNIYKSKASYIVNDDRRLDQNDLSFSSSSINLDRKIKESFKNSKVFGSLHGGLLILL